MSTVNKIKKTNIKRENDTQSRPPTKSRNQIDVNKKKSSTEIVIKNKQLSSLIPIITDLISLAAKKVYAHFYFIKLFPVIFINSKI